MNPLNPKTAMAVTLLACCASASSQAPSTAFNPSWYVSPSLNVMDPDPAFGVNSNGYGAGLRFGKATSEYWDVQMGLTSARSSNNTSGYRQTTLGVDALYMFSRNTLRPFVMFGAGLQHDRADTPLGNTAQTSPYLGLGFGVQAMLGDQWSVQADFRRNHAYMQGNSFAFPRSNTNYLTVGFNYAFEKPAAVARTAAPPSPTALAFPAAPPEPMPVVVAAPPPPAPMPAPLPAARFERYALSATELFSFDSAELHASQPKLDEIAMALQSNSQINNVVITGYTDRIGSEKYNQKLSESRAMAVKNYLTGKGLNASRLTAGGKGEANPVVLCTDKNQAALIKCLEPNRRVEIDQMMVERRVN